MKSPIFNLDSLGSLDPFRAALERTGYTAKALAATLDIKTPADSIDFPVLLRRTDKPDDYHALFRLFMLAQPVPESRLCAALAPMPIEALVAGGLLIASPEGMRSSVKLVPHDDMYFVSDFSYPVRAEPVAEDHVLGVGPASMTLSVLTVRKSAASVFDLGCGAGIQSILASRHAKSVVGTDISPRALNFAAFNARLNGINNVDWRAGSFFDPVAGETFDLVVANPPFVISPQSGLLYRDSGMGGDAVSEHVLKGAASKLNEGGFATMLINWHHEDEDDWEQRPKNWCANLGCDCWLIRSGTLDPLSYAASWLRFHEARNPDHYGQMLDQWMAYYERLGIKQISAGAVILRKRTSAANWVRCDTVDNVQGSGQCSDTIQRVFAAEDFLQRSGQDSELLEQRLILHPDVTADQHLVVSKGGWAVESLLLNLREGFPFSGKADVHIMKLLAHCDGKRSVRELIQSLAEGLETTYSALAPTCLGVVKKMIRSGMLTEVATF